jgi:hypothetical protein
MKKLALSIAFMGFISVHAMELEEKERTAIEDIYNVDKVVQVLGPLVYLAQGETYKPSSFDWYLNRVALKNSKLQTIKATGSVTPQDLADHPEANNFLDPNGDKKTYAGIDLQNGTVVAPMYINFKVAQDEKSATMQTIYFYPFNGATPFLKFWKPLVYDVFGKSVGDHEADLERTTFNLIYDVQKEDWRIVSGYYSHHGSGILVDAKNISFENTHPIVYSSKYGHASYPDHFYLNFEADTTSQGARWEGWNQYEILDRSNPSAAQKWIEYAGRLGVDKKQNLLSEGTQPAPTGLSARNWFKNVTN